MTKERDNLLTASTTQCFGCSRFLWSCAGTARVQSKYRRTRTIKNIKWLVIRKPVRVHQIVSPPTAMQHVYGSVWFYLENPFRKSYHIVISLIALLVDFQTAAHTGAPGRLRGE